MESDFVSGGSFRFKPKGGPNLVIGLKDVQPGRRFVDVTKFPLAKMYGDHEFVEQEGGAIEIRTTVSIEGPLGFLWRKIVGEDVAKSLPQQTEKFVQRARDA